MRCRLVYVVVAKARFTNEILAIDVVCYTKEHAEEVIRQQTEDGMLYSDRMYWTYIPTMAEEE